jgi:hypothetical protein
VLPRTQAPLATPLIVAGAATVFSATYALVGMDPRPPVALFVQFGPALSLVSWTVADLRGTDLASIFDWGLLQCYSWPVLIPWYLKRRYGRGAWPLLGLFLVLLLAPSSPKVLWRVFSVWFSR